MSKSIYRHFLKINEQINWEIESLMQKIENYKKDDRYIALYKKNQVKLSEIQNDDVVLNFKNNDIQYFLNILNINETSYKALDKKILAAINFICTMYHQIANDSQENKKNDKLSYSNNKEQKKIFEDNYPQNPNKYFIALKNKSANNLSNNNKSAQEKKEIIKSKYSNDELFKARILIETLTSASPTQQDIKRDVVHLLKDELYNILSSRDKTEYFIDLITREIFLRIQYHEFDNKTLNKLEGLCSAIDNIKTEHILQQLKKARDQNKKNNEIFDDIL